MNIWTPDRVDQLLAGVADGLTGSQLARAMGAGFTRNMCISKASRLGLKLRSGLLSSERKRMAKLKAPPQTRPAPILHLPPEYRTLREMEGKRCKWAMNDVPPGHGDELRFCGKPSAPERAYCQAHCDKAYDRVFVSRSQRAA